MKNKFWVICVTLLLIVGLMLAAGCNNNKESTDSGAEEPKQETINLKFGHVLAPEHPYQLGALKFAELVKEKTDGRINISVFHSSQIGNERDMIEGLQMGSVDLTLVSTAPLMGFTKKFMVFDLPFIFRDRDHAYKTLDGEIGQSLLKTLEQNQILGLAYWENGFRHMYNSQRPLINPEDVKGLKIRVMENKLHMAMVKAFGGDPTPMAWGEVFTALQQNVVDGAEAPLPAIETSKHYEVQKYLSLTNHLYAPAALLMSPKTFNSLSQEDQKAILDAALEARDYERELIRKADEELVKGLADKGMEVIEVDLDKWYKAAQPVYQEFEGDIGKDLIQKVQNVK